MGRGQVLRNQRLGRPGQRHGSDGGGGRRGEEERRGRGRGRGQQRDNSKRFSSQSQQQPYETTTTTTTAHIGIASSSSGPIQSTIDKDVRATTKREEDEEELMLGVFETQGNYYGSTGENENKFHDLQDTTFWKNSDPIASWNMQLVDQALIKVSLSDILGLPPHVTKSMENPTRQLIGTTLRNMNEANKDGEDEYKNHANESVIETKIAETKHTKMEEDPKSDDDDEDLESWLDSVIS
jgi:hypothetical protein